MSSSQSRRQSMLLAYRIENGKEPSLWLLLASVWNFAQSVGMRRAALVCSEYHTVPMLDEVGHSCVVTLESR